MIKVKHNWNKLIYIDDDFNKIIIKKPLPYIIIYLLGNKKHNYMFGYCPSCKKNTYNDPHHTSACVCGRSKIISKWCRNAGFY